MSPLFSLFFSEQNTAKTVVRYMHSKPELCHRFICNTKRYELFFLFQYEPVITPGNEAYVYRIVFYRCDMNGVDLQGKVFDCDTAPVQVKSCKTTVASWSMGGEVRIRCFRFVCTCLITTSKGITRI